MTYLVRRKADNRKGFTLPEILVSITLVAVLAAVVVPTITSQIKKADPSRVGNDLLAVRGGVEQFLTDVRRYPASITQLLTVPVSGTDKPLIGTSTATYGVAEVARWRGPYLQKDPSTTATGGGTGFGLSLTAAFDTVSFATSGDTSATGQKYMVTYLNFSTASDPSATEIDKQFDDGNPLTGVIRVRNHGTTSSTLIYLLMPVY